MVDDGTNWRAAKWIWDTQTGAGSDQLAFDVQNAGYPAFALERVAFKAPAGPPEPVPVLRPTS